MVRAYPRSVRSFSKAMQCSDLPEDSLQYNWLTARLSDWRENGNPYDLAYEISRAELWPEMARKLADCFRYEFQFDLDPTFDAERYYHIALERPVYG